MTTLNIDGLILIGKILNARENKLRQSKLYKQRFGDTEAMLKRTREDVNSFGMYGDCGPSYERAYDEAKIQHEQAQNFLPELIKSEKFYKKLKHQLREQHPELMSIFRQKFNEQTKALEARYKLS